MSELLIGEAVAVKYKGKGQQRFLFGIINSIERDADGVLVGYSIKYQDGDVGLVLAKDVVPALEAML